MRIRKRFPPASFSSPPLSDPQLNRSPVVQQSAQSNTQAYPDGNLPAEQVNSCSHLSDPPNQPPPRPSDHQPMIGSERARWVFSYSSTKAQDQVKQKELEGELVEGEGWGEEEKSSNDTRKGSIFGAKVGIELLPPSSSSHQGRVGRWSEGDKVVPLKKRRGSFERRGEEDENILMEKGKKKRMKSKTNKKCNAQIDGDDDEEGNVIDDNDGEKKKKKKKVRRGNVIMEGSRCSRVNGRGWRCCQKTLVGYSLCEHHLGKGRLRSMTSVRGKDEQLSSTSSNLRKQLGQKILLDKEEEEDDDEEEEEEEEKKKKPLMVMKKKMKLGVVKARSISSLLGQTNSGVLFADNNKNSRV